MAGNEIHSIVAQNSKFFQEFVGKKFNYASCLAHKKYNVCLIGVAKSRIKTNENASQQHEKNPSFSSSSNEYIVLNPGPNYDLVPDDICLYISLVKEENYDWIEAKARLCINTNFEFNLKLLISFFSKDAVEELYHNEFCIGPDLNLRKIANAQKYLSIEMIDENNNEYNNVCF